MMEDILEMDREKKEPIATLQKSLQRQSGLRIGPCPFAGLTVDAYQQGVWDPDHLFEFGITKLLLEWFHRCMSRDDRMRYAHRVENFQFNRTWLPITFDITAKLGVNHSMMLFRKLGIISLIALECLITDEQYEFYFDFMRLKNLVFQRELSQDDILQIQSLTKKVVTTGLTFDPRPPPRPPDPQEGNGEEDDEEDKEDVEDSGEDDGEESNEDVEEMTGPEDDEQEVLDSSTGNNKKKGLRWRDRPNVLGLLEFAFRHLPMMGNSHFARTSYFEAHHKEAKRILEGLAAQRTPLGSAMHMINVNDSVRYLLHGGPWGGDRTKTGLRLDPTLLGPNTQINAPLFEWYTRYLPHSRNSAGSDILTPSFINGNESKQDSDWRPIKFVSYREIGETEREQAKSLGWAAPVKGQPIPMQLNKQEDDALECFFEGMKDRAQKQMATGRKCKNELFSGRDAANGFVWEVEKKSRVIYECTALVDRSARTEKTLQREDDFSVGWKGSTEYGRVWKMLAIHFKDAAVIFVAAVFIWYNKLTDKAHASKTGLTQVSDIKRYSRSGAGVKDYFNMNHPAMSSFEALLPGFIEEIVMLQHDCRSSWPERCKEEFVCGKCVNIPSGWRPKQSNSNEKEICQHRTGKRIKRTHHQLRSRRRREFPFDTARRTGKEKHCEGRRIWLVIDRAAGYEAESPLNPCFFTQKKG
jgi:hypothetical protein